VGFKFYSRAEMTVTGFHFHWLNGIDYIASTDAKKAAKADPGEAESNPDHLACATSVMLSDVYQDDNDAHASTQSEIVYTGQAGAGALGHWGTGALGHAHLPLVPTRFAHAVCGPRIRSHSVCA
jgi:euchromatic histone-lysine N-methyltransferase